MDVGRWMLGCSSLDVLTLGCWTLDVGRCMLDVVHHGTLYVRLYVRLSNARTLDVRMLDVGRWTLDVVGLCWTLDVGRWTVGPLDRWTL